MWLSLLPVPKRGGGWNIRRGEIVGVLGPNGGVGSFTLIRQTIRRLRGFIRITRCYMSRARRGRDGEGIVNRHPITERTGLRMLFEFGADDVFNGHGAGEQGVWGVFSDVLAMSLRRGEKRVQGRR